MSYEKGRKLVGDYPWRVTADCSGVSFNGSAGFVANDWSRGHTPKPILEMICTCVNTHDAMVSALRDALPVLEEMETWEWGNGGAEVLPEADAVRRILNEIDAAA